MAGLAASFVLPGGGAQAACRASGLVRGFSAFNQGMMWAGAAESVANIASTGEVTFGDAIGLLGPLAHALGQRTGKMVSNGGCFVAGTLVALAALPQGWQGASRDPWAETTWLESFLAEEREFSAPLAMPAPEAAALAVAAELAAAVRIAIEQVPVGARVQTRNPRRWEYDDSLPEPDEATWAKLSLTVQRSDGGLVDAELLRPRAWIELHGLRAGELLPLHLAELEVSGPALVTAIEACPPIASGAGSVVTARFVTREVHRLVSVDLLGAGGELETLTGTPVHPVWSLDRGDWVPLAELTEGETLQGHTGPAIVLHLSLHQAAQPVYNLEIHGEHVYQLGELGVLVHNAYIGVATRGGHHGIAKFLGGDQLQELVRGTTGWDDHHALFHRLLNRRLQRAGLLPGNTSADNYAEFFRANPSSQLEAFEVVQKLATSFDKKYSTDFLSGFFQNFMQGRFQRYGW